MKTGPGQGQDTGLFHQETPPLCAQLPLASSKSLGSFCTVGGEPGNLSEMGLSQVLSGLWVVSTACTFGPAFPGPRMRLRHCEDPSPEGRYSPSGCPVFQILLPPSFFLLILLFSTPHPLTRCSLGTAPRQTLSRCPPCPPAWASPPGGGVGWFLKAQYSTLPHHSRGSPVMRGVEGWCHWGWISLFKRRKEPLSRSPHQVPTFASHFLCVATLQTGEVG